MTLLQAYDLLYTAVLVILSVLVLAMLVRAIRGPRVADRIVSVNMIGTMTIAIIGVLAMMQNEGYLVDVGLIYALVSFLTVVVLCKVYMGVAAEQKQKEAADGVADADAASDAANKPADAKAESHAASYADAQPAANDALPRAAQDTATPEAPTKEETPDA